MADAAVRIHIAVVEGTLDAVREAIRLAHQLASQAVEHLVGLGPRAIGLTEAETGKGSGRVEVDGENGPQV